MSLSTGSSMEGAGLPAGLPSAVLAAVTSLYLALLLAGVGIDVALVVRGLARPERWARGLARLRARPWTQRLVLRLALLLLGIELAMGIALSAVRRANGLAGLDPEYAQTVVALVHGLVFHGAALVILAGLMKARGWTWRRAFGLGAGGVVQRLGAGLALYAGSLPVFFVSAAVSHLALRQFGFAVDIQEVVLVFVQPQSPWLLAGLLGMALVTAPLAEELLFRGVLLPALLKRMGPGPAVVLSSAFFAAMHLHGPALFPLFVLAIGFSLAYIYTGSLWAPMLMHAAFNGMNLALVFLTSS